MNDNNEIANQSPKKEDEKK
jgi:hypothetical protein